MPVNGRRKGSAFERQVAKMIIATFEGRGITAEDCYRTPLSGGHVHASKENPSDLQMSAKLLKLFPYSVECKCYRKVNLFPAMYLRNNKGQLAEWWKQAVKACNGREPLVVFKQNGSDIFVMAKSHVAKERGAFPWLATRMADGSAVRIWSFSRFLESFE